MTLMIAVDLSATAGGGGIRIESAQADQTATSEDGRIVCGICSPAAGAAAIGRDRGNPARTLLESYRARPAQWPADWVLPAAGYVVDLGRNEVHAAVDRMGVESLYFSLSGSRLRIASRARDCTPTEDVRPALSPTALFAYVYFHHIPSPISAFEGIQKLKRASALQFIAGRGVSTRTYHEASFNERGDVDLEAASAELLAVLRRSVRRASNAIDTPGAFLSGGLDSSTVSGLMAECVHAGEAHTFSIGFDAEGYDEIEYARVAVAHFGLRGHEYYVTPADVLSTAPGLLAGLDEPFGNSSIVAAYHCAAFARSEGVSGLLAGDGGDELFSGNSRYAKQLIFQRYDAVPGALRRLLLEPLLLPLGRTLPQSPFGKAARYIAQAKVPLPDRLQSYNYLHRHAPGEVFSSAMLERVDTGLPLRLWREEYGRSESAATINRMLYLDWAFTLHDNDLVKVNAACRAAGMPVTYPMLDNELVDFSCTLPGEVKMRNGELRSFYKQAVRGFLPDRIIDKTKHGFGLPFGVWTRTDPGLARIAAQALEALAVRGVFRREFLAETLRLHREGHATYYGELVWILTALELWLQSNAAEFRV